MNFWIAIISLILIAIAILLIPLLRPSRRDEADQREQQNIHIAREQKQQLDNQLAEGEINQVTYDSTFIDLKASLALELKTEQPEIEKAQGSWMALLLLE